MRTTWPSTSNASPSTSVSAPLGSGPSHRATTSRIVCSASPIRQAWAPAARYTSGWSVTSAPLTATRHPAASAMPTIVTAASRMRVRHIFDRKLKLSSYSTTTDGR